MGWGLVGRAFSAAGQCLLRQAAIVAAGALAASVAGCASGPSGDKFAQVSPIPGRATVAFESIDGPPSEVFRKAVVALNDEAGARRVPVVSRSASATYRVRGYMSAVVERDKTSIAWVWDVYDADRRRILRIAGEEPAGAANKRDAWAAADDRVVRGMARTGIERLTAFLNDPGIATPPPSLPEEAAVTLASMRDDSPESAGIVRRAPADDPATGSSPMSETGSAGSPAKPPQRSAALQERR